ncbi:hypothetical protein C1646_771825 [Rhizophagus diaphanus]|nr:hypothetical protein C1646_771825 [Rhizophagus diaphanus] [Rhizophagus sp. MUCL 43196]
MQGGMTKSYSREIKDNSIHQRFDLQMGHVLGGLCNTWKMVKNGTASSHQHSRVKSDLVCFFSLQGLKKPTDYNMHRQYDMRCLHKSSGRNNFYFTVKDSERAMDSLSGTECLLKSRTHHRNSEFNGRSSFSNEDRQIRLKVENQLVLFLDTGSWSGGSECFSLELGTHEFVGQPSMDTFSENISQSNQKQGHDNDINTLLNVSTMVPTVIIPFDCFTNFNLFNQYYRNRHEPSSASSEEPKMENDEEQLDGKRQINVYNPSWRSKEIYNIISRHPRGASNWTYIEQNTPADTDFSEPETPIQTEENLIMMEDVEVTAEMDKIAVIEDSELIGMEESELTEMEELLETEDETDKWKFLLF